VKKSYNVVRQNTFKFNIPFMKTRDVKAVPKNKNKKKNIGQKHFSKHPLTGFE